MQDVFPLLAKDPDGIIPNTDLHNQLGLTKAQCTLPHPKTVSFATAAHQNRILLHVNNQSNKPLRN